MQRLIVTYVTPWLAGTLLAYPTVGLAEAAMAGRYASYDELKKALLSGYDIAVTVHLGRCIDVAKE